MFYVSVEAAFERILALVLAKQVLMQPHLNSVAVAIGTINIFQYLDLHFLTFNNNI